MALAPGTHLGPYEVLAPLGAGGMGEVYRARDTRLGREVAVKVLPEHLSANPEVRARFEREAKTISSFNHPHICTLFDVGQEGDTHYLIMELIEGQTLADRLDRGSLPAAELLQIGSQIADALERAHRAGVIHRDLKPSNVMLTKAGAKLMDFGLARAALPESESVGQSISPTMSRPLTAEGTIVGTFQYMAPEQLEGKESDSRSDLWALGCVLYEMATGKRAFSGASQASLIGKIMNGEPAPMQDLQPLAPPALERLVQACLAKDPSDRIQSAHDVRLQLAWIAEGGSLAGVPAPVAARRKSRELIAWVAAGVFAVGLAIVGGRQLLSSPTKPPLTQLSLVPPRDAHIDPDPNSVSISPDGSRIVFRAFSRDGTPSLWVRDLETLDAVNLPGTEGAAGPFWSPDGRSLCFFTTDRMKRVDTEGGSPEVMASLQNSGRGGCWGPDGTILFAPGPGTPIYALPPGGGEPKPITKLDSLETDHRFPQFLPDGRHFLYAALPAPRGSDIYIGDLQAGTRERLFSADGVPQYVEPGFLVYTRNDRIVVQSFDANQRKLIGEPTVLGDAVSPTEWTGRNRVTASRNGVIVYRREQLQATELVKMDLAGNLLAALDAPTGRYEGIKISPDGTRAALVKRISSAEDELWIFDLDRGTSIRLTAGSERVAAPVWSPDGARIVYASDRDGHIDLYVKDVHGGTAEKKILSSAALFKYPRAWSPDGKTLLYSELSKETSWDIWALPMEGDPTPRPYIQTPAQEGRPSFSPEGDWVVYETDETGRQEIVVRSFPNPDHRFALTRDGGLAPMWSRDGNQIYYLNSVRRVAVFDVTISLDGLQASAPRVEGPEYSRRIVTMDLAWDESFLLAAVLKEEVTENEPLTVILNWRENLATR